MNDDMMHIAAKLWTTQWSVWWMEGRTYKLSPYLQIWYQLRCICWWKSKRRGKEKISSMVCQTFFSHIRSRTSSKFDTGKLQKIWFCWLKNVGLVVFVPNLWMELNQDFLSHFFWSRWVGLRFISCIWRLNQRGLVVCMCLVTWNIINVHVLHWLKLLCKENIKHVIYCTGVIAYCG